MFANKKIFIFQLKKWQLFCDSGSTYQLQIHTRVIFTTNSSDLYLRARLFDEESGQIATVHRQFFLTSIDRADGGLTARDFFFSF